MRSGICPKCESQEVYAGTRVAIKGGRYGSNTIPLRSLFAFSRTKANLDNYVCGSCGYVECYIADTQDLDYIKEKWPRVPLG